MAKVTTFAGGATGGVRSINTIVSDYKSFVDKVNTELPKSVIGKILRTKLRTK